MSRKSLTPILLPTDPTAALEAATKQYVDNQRGFRYGISVRYTATGTFDIDDYPGIYAVIAELVGGGGAGGGATATSGSQMSAGGGGSGGDYVRTDPILAAVIGSSAIAVTIGDGGVGHTLASDGPAGSDSVFGPAGTYATAKGGPGGIRGAANALPSRGGSGGAAPTGSSATLGGLIISGQPGSSLVLTNLGRVIAAAGGSSYMGMGPAQRTSTTLIAGANGGLYGAGGGGGANDASNAAQKGGDGAKGIIIVTPVYKV